ncbi:CLIP domain-containing serine protease 14D-like [Pollicipes pollicipes]|uniref:CLIP domain-containing serine protease 14D-like n=1 Tax=Pollicipes pollicipes TaxID=41117 RepID=UPI001884F79F|nr:CLIP domain-containing serine protease 14D-like [Pollicipes pollicipes]
MRLLSLMVAACALVSGSAAARTRRQSGPSACQDFAKRNGTCGTIQDCPALFRLVSNGRRPTDGEIANLRASQCGDNGRGLVLVCCAYSRSNPFDGPPEEHPNRAVVSRGGVCGATLSPRITGGHGVRMGEYPWVALLGYGHSSSDNITYDCGGVLISQQHVLTAAHCVTGLPPDFHLETVRLGEHNVSQDVDCRTELFGLKLCNAPQDFRIAELAVHRDYNKPTVRLNDIALLKLDRPVIEDHFVGKICLPFGDVGRENYTGRQLTAAGFGRVGAPDGPASDVLLAVQLPGVAQDTCAQIIRRLGGTLGPRQLCAGGEHGRDVCFGDSGTPLMTTEPQRSLIGLVAYGALSCQGQVPGVFTRVSSYLNWILDRID